MRVKLRFTGISVPPQIFTSNDDSATVADFLAFVKTHTNGERYTIKGGYPPETIYFQTFEQEDKLADLPVKLNGSQLTVNVEGKKEEATNRGDGGKTSPSSSKVAASRFSLSGRKPSPTTNPTRGINKDDPPDVQLPGRGVVILRVMPDDNSCLFRAVSYALGKGIYSATELRSLVAGTIAENPDTYSKAVLDQEPSAYCEWIQMESSWGGGIELAILASFFEVEIASIDVQTGSVIRFNEGKEKRAIVVYSGIHYDALALSPYRNADPGSDVCVFESEDDAIMSGAVELVGKLRERHYHTDTKNFSLRCGTCGKGLKGQNAAVEHSKETGHTDFREYAD